jgi:hypothetical protein
VSKGCPTTTPAMPPTVPEVKSMSTEGLASWAIGLGVKHAVRVGREASDAHRKADRRKVGSSYRSPLAIG